MLRFVLAVLQARSEIQREELPTGLNAILAFGMTCEPRELPRVAVALRATGQRTTHDQRFRLQHGACRAGYRIGHAVTGHEWRLLRSCRPRRLTGTG